MLDLHAGLASLSQSGSVMKSVKGMAVHSGTCVSALFHLAKDDCCQTQRLSCQAVAGLFLCLVNSTPPSGPRP
jgi:hypothetical protein